MRKIFKPLIIYLLVLVVGFAGGTVFGFFNGLGSFALIDSAPKGAIAVANLNSLAKGNPAPVIILLENDIDQSLAFYSRLTEAWWYSAYQSGLLLTDPSDSEKYIRRVATYRYLHPSFAREDIFDKVPEGKEQYASEYKELALGIREHLRRVNDMVEKYAEIQPNPALKRDSPRSGRAP